MRGNGVFWGFTKRIPLLKQRNWRGNRAAGAETGCFGDLQNELRCKNNGIRGETAHLARKRGVLGIHKTNYVVKTTEFAERPRGGRGNGVFWGFTKRITLLKQRNWRGNRAAGAVSKWKAVRAAARCRKSVRKTQIGQARRHYPHGGEVTRQKLCAGKMRGGNSASGQAGNHIIGIPAASSATYGRRQCGDGCSSPFFHYYNIIVAFLICRDFFDRAPKAP